MSENLIAVMNFMATLLFLGDKIEGEKVTREIVLSLKSTGSRNFDFIGLKSYLWTKGFSIKKGKIVKDSRKRVVAVCLPFYTSDDLYKWESVGENACKDYCSFASANSLDKVSFKPLDVEYFENVMAGYADTVEIFPADLLEFIPENIGWIFEGWQEER